VEDDNDNDDMTLEQVLAFIYDANKDDLSRIGTALRDAWNHTQAEAAMSFRRGDKVQFTARRDGMTRTGTVTKVNRKSVKVKVDGRYGVENWNVGPSLLKKV
jgi:hypothetical protein